MSSDDNSNTASSSTSLSSLDSSPPSTPVSPLALLSGNIAATIMGVASIAAVWDLMRSGVLAPNWGALLLALLVLPADVGVKLVRRVLTGK